MERHGSKARRSRRAVVAAAAALSLGASAVVAAPGALAGGSGDHGGGGGGDAGGPLYQNAQAPIPQRVADLMSRMTLDEKVGQMTQAERAAVADSPAQITDLALGSLLSGGGSVPTPNTPQAWADMVDN